MGLEAAHSPAPFECLLLHCNTSRSRPPVRLPSLTFEADCGSTKGTGVTTKEGTKHSLPCCGIHDIFNHCQRRKTDRRKERHGWDQFL